MFTPLTRRLTIASIMFVMALALANGLIHSEQSEQSAQSAQSGSYLLQAPAFINAAEAANASGGLVFQDEAGSAAYCQNPNGIELSTVAGLYQVIENLQTYETDGYIIGRMDIPDITHETLEPRIYIDTNGWVVAFYPDEEPLGYILIMGLYDGSTVPFLLDWTLEYLASFSVIPTGCISYYDFRYPNATHMAIIGEADGGTFEIQVPDTYQLYRSGVSSYGGNVYLNGNLLVDGSELHIDITSPPLATGVLHEFETSATATVVILLYSEE